MFAPDGRLTIDKVKSKETIADFKMAAETKLGIQSSGTVKIRHLIYSISGAEMTGEAQAKVERLKLGDILAEYPGAEIKVFVLRYKAEEQQLADRAVKLKANLNLEGSSVRFALSKLGLYDVVTVVTLPSQPAAPASETQEQPQENQPTAEQTQADQPAETPAEPFKQVSTVGNVKITLTAEAGVFAADAKVEIAPVSSQALSQLAEQALGVTPGKYTLVYHYMAA